MEPCLNQATVMQCSAEEFVRAAANAGFRQVELRFEKVEEYLMKQSVRTLRQLLSRLDVKVVGLDGLELFSLIPEDNYPLIAKKAELLLSVCEWLDAEMLVLVPSHGREDMNRQEVLALTADRLNRLGELAKAKHIRLALEIVGNRQFSLRRIDDALQVLQRLPENQVVLALDNICLHEGGNELGDLAPLTAGAIGLVHANDVRVTPNREYELADRVFPGEGELDLHPFFALLKEKGYEGPVSVELFNPKIWSLSAEEAAKRAWCSIQQFLA